MANSVTLNQPKPIPLGEFYDNDPGTCNVRAIRTGSAAVCPSFPHEIRTPSPFVLARDWLGTVTATEGVR